MFKHPIQIAAELLASDLNSNPLQPVRRAEPVYMGNRNPDSRYFSLRSDIVPHMHKPGRYYCGRCMLHVVI